jgi:signal transduction histidine kinase
VEIDVRHPLAEVWCNRHRFKQLLTNLVRNAVRHGCDPQRPRISVTAEEKAVCPTPVGPRAGPDRFVVLRIHDNGPGIDPRYHEEIFLPGRRLPRAAPEGTGMGLAIVRKIAEHYGGSAELDRDCPGGTAFLVRLPRAPDRTDAPAGHAPPPRQSAQGPRRPAHDPFGQGLILHPPRPSSQPAGPHGR